MGLWKAYTRMLNLYPTITASVSTAILMGTGDVIAQKVIEEKKCLDKERTGRFILLGAFYFGPCCSKWYRYLDQLVPRMRVPKPYAGLVKTTLDQGLFAPVILFGFMNFVGILRREDITFRWLDIKANYPDILVNNYKFWPIIQLFNFYVVPLQHRLMVVNLAALCWNTYLSWRTNQNIPEARVKELLPDVDVGYWAESHHRDNDGTYWVKK